MLVGVPLPSDYASQACSMARALEVVGERWTLLILRDLFYGVRHFTDLQRHLGIPRAVLAARLEGLVDAGLVARAEPGPGRTDYRLTPRGEATWPVLFALYAWGDEPVEPARRRRLFRHVGCTTEVDPTGRCPACGTLAQVAELEVHPGPGLAGEPAPRDSVGRALLAPHRMLTPLP